MEVQQEGKSHPPPPTAAIFTTQEVINHSVKCKISKRALSPEKTCWLNFLHTHTHHKEDYELTDIMTLYIKPTVQFLPSTKWYTEH